MTSVPPWRRAKRAVKSVLGRVDPRFTDDPGWAIGLYEGRSPLHLGPVPERPGPIVHPRHLRGRRVSTAADPFALRIDDVWYLFYEVMDQRVGRGHIAVSSSPDLRTWRHLGPVLREPFHLSYPHVFRHGDEVLLVPEAWESGAVRLYRAADFPTRWVHVGDLLTGPVLLDPTVFSTGDDWWLFVDTSPDERAGELRLFHGPAPRGPWEEHPASPVVRGDPGRSRPAGRVVVWDDGAPVRLAQDCTDSYGSAVHAFRIDRLDATRYEETELDGPVVAGTASGWSAGAMHHVDLHRVAGGWIAFVDGHR